MTYLTFANYFNFIYIWIAVWCTLTVLLMLSRRGKHWADYDVINFRFAVAGVCWAVVANRIFNSKATVVEPVVTWFLAALVFFHAILGYAAFATAIRVALTIWRRRKSQHVHQPPHPEH